MNWWINQEQFDNIKKYIDWEWKLNKTSKDIIERFNKDFRILIIK
jgi:hypothetical protein